MKLEPEDDGDVTAYCKPSAPSSRPPVDGPRQVALFRIHRLAAAAELAGERLVAAELRLMLHELTDGVP